MADTDADRAGDDAEDAGGADSGDEDNSSTTPAKDERGALGLMRPGWTGAATAPHGREAMCSLVWLGDGAGGWGCLMGGGGCMGAEACGAAAR